MEINSDEVHIWFCNLKSAAYDKKFSELLSQDERDRSGRFIFSHLRERFVLVRAALRLILSHYLHMPASRIEFCYEKYGKPQLPQGHEIKFNLSHSGDWAVFAISLKNEVGVDIEEIREEIYSIDLEALCLSKREQVLLEGLSFEERIQRFYTLWVCKEAVLKGLGCGLQYPIHELELDLSGIIPRIKRGGLNFQGWMLYLLPTPINFKGAFSVRGKERKMLLREWQNSSMMEKLPSL